MENFRTYLNQISGLRYMFDHLAISSGIGRQRILNQPFITDPFVLKMEFEFLATTLESITDDSHQKSWQQIIHKLFQINDIHKTIELIADGQILDDIQLFEVKKMAMSTQEIIKELGKINFYLLPFYDLEAVVSLLDPDKTGIPHFYIYSSYHPQLEIVRKKFDQAKTVQEREQYRFEALKIEDQVREELSAKLRNFHEALHKNLDQLAYLDVLIVKALQAKEMHLCRPEIGTEKTSYKQLFHPAVSATLEESGKKFQPIDIELNNAPCLITGANMSGKTVLLKTVALAQFLFQFGFYVPACEAVIMPVEEILFSIGDQQSEMNGLSSFAVEILNINKIIVEAKQGRKILALVDELARTTNPDEGKALVRAFIRLMAQNQVDALITSHYSGIQEPCRRLRVKGLNISKVTSKISPKEIVDYMDYSLVETDNDDVPMEAIRIAEIFEVDEEFLNLAKIC